VVIFLTNQNNEAVHRVIYLVPAKTFPISYTTNVSYIATQARAMLAPCDWPCSHGEQGASSKQQAGSAAKQEELDSW
jgi:hypothetical protein